MSSTISLELLVASGIGLVTACGIYLLLRGRTYPVVLGLTLIGYAVNVFIFATGRLWAGAPPILAQQEILADPLPQALVLTAIVIGFATTGFIIELALRSRHESGTDHVDGRDGEHHSRVDLERGDADMRRNNADVGRNDASTSRSGAHARRERRP